MMDIMLLVLVVVLIAINAFFVTAEYALVRSRRARLVIMKEEGVRGASLALKQLESINEYISAIQIGITLTSIGIGALGEPALASILHNALGKTLSHGVAIALSAAIAFIVIATTQLVAGEMVPKFYVIGRSEGVARRIARPLQIFSAFFHPFVIALTNLSSRILRLFGVKVSFEEHGGTDEIKLLISESHEDGQIDPGEAGMLTGVFHLHAQEARQVMTPSPEIDAIDISQDVEAALTLCASSGHTRLVVTEDEDLDRVRGLVHVSTIAKRFIEEGPQATLEPIVQDAMIVPETKPLDDLLSDLQRRHNYMAVVVDEYGRVAGIVSIEDIVEEVVGEIADETDPATEEDVVRLANGEWLVQGQVPVTDLPDHGLDLLPSSEDYNSVGGFVFSELGRLPQVGDVVSTDAFSIRVEAVDGNRIESVLVHENHIPSPDDE